MFSTEFKNAYSNIKTRITSMIGNGYSFSCITVDISKSVTFKDDETHEIESETIYPSTSELSSWLTKLFTIEMPFKPLPLKALEALQAKGLPVKKQPVEILNIIICNSSTDVVVLEHDPEKIYSEFGSQVRIIPSDEAFKARDAIMQSYFDKLKASGIYSPENDDD